MNSISVQLGFFLHICRRFSKKTSTNTLKCNFCIFLFFFGQIRIISNSLSIYNNHLSVNFRLVIFFYPLLELSVLCFFHQIQASHKTYNFPLVTRTPRIPCSDGGGVTETGITAECTPRRDQRGLYGRGERRTVVGGSKSGDSTQT